MGRKGRLLNRSGFRSTNLHVRVLTRLGDGPELWRAVIFRVLTNGHAGCLVSLLVVWVAKTALAVVSDDRVWTERLHYCDDIVGDDRSGNRDQAHLVEDALASWAAKSVDAHTAVEVGASAGERMLDRCGLGVVSGQSGHKLCGAEGAHLLRLSLKRLQVG